MDSALWLLSSIVFLPALGALALAFFPGNRPDAIKYFTLAVTIAVLVLCVVGFLAPNSPTTFSLAKAEMQDTFNVPWIPSFQIEYLMGVDGISLPLLMLTAFVMLISMGASWTIEKHVKGYCILFLLLETGILGCFVALDFFLFYVFWEVMLLPMYFLIGVWGGPRREYAAIKFFLYTLAGSVLMLIAILMLYFHSDLRTLAQAEAMRGGSPSFNWHDLHLGQGTNKSVGRLVGTDVNEDFRRQQGDNASPDARVMPDALTLQRLDKALSRPLAISIVEGEESQTKFDAEHHVVRITLPKDKLTASDLVAAVNADPEISQSVLGAAFNEVDNGPVTATTHVILPYDKPVHTFNILALTAMGQHTALFNVKIIDLSQSSWFAGTFVERWLSGSLSWWAFLLLFIGFIIKVPSVPVHTWLPDAHVEAPTPISMILAGVLLKLGGYGIIRICYPICPLGGYELANLVCGLGVISMVYGAFAALAQKDFKRMVAYSSVSHMGYVLLGLGVWSARAGLEFNPDYWIMGVKGAMFQMIAHGISSPGMFLMVGIIYERVHHRNLEEFGGLFDKMPVYTALAMGIFFAGLGLPGLCGFWGEVFVVLSVWNYSYALAVVSAAVVILTAAYILWAIQRVYLGPEYKGPHGDHIHPSTARENLLGGVLLAGCLIMGLAPYQTVLKYMDATIDRQVENLTAWTRIKEGNPGATPPAMLGELPAAREKPVANLLGDGR